MFSEKIFLIALIVSLGLHAAILIQNPNFSIFTPKQKETTPEISYVKEPLKASEEEKQVSSQKREPFLKLSSKITADKRNPPPFIEKQASPSRNIDENIPKPSFERPTFTRPDISAIKKKITLPPVGLDKINNPTYISYYQIVREKIRRAAYQNHNRAETGNIYISFIISSDGYLQETRLSEERSAPSRYLREVALRSVKDASPFPNFPKDLNYPQLSFNIEISFDLE